MNVDVSSTQEMYKEERDATPNSKSQDESSVQMLETTKERNRRYNDNTMIIMKERHRVLEIIQNNEEMMRNIQLNHMKLKDDIISKMKDVENQCLLEVEYLEQENKKLNKRLEELEKKTQQMEDDNNGSEYAIPETDFDESEESNAHFQTWLEDFQEKMSIEEKVRRGIAETAERNEEMIISLNEILEYSEREVTDLSEQREALLRMQNLTGKLLTCDMLQNLSPAMKFLGRLDGIYAIDEFRGKRKCAKISFSSDNKILLHCLTHEKLPPHVSTIQHRDVKSLIHPSSRTVFLDIATPKSILGQIMINLTPNTKRAENFTILCSGELGPSYLNTSIAEVICNGSPGESVLFSKIRGEKAVVPGSGLEMGVVFEQPDIAGSLVGIYGDQHASKFWITTRDNPTALGAIVFGQVESGLHILSEAIAINPLKKKVNIIDCGIVISL